MKCFDFDYWFLVLFLPFPMFYLFVSAPCVFFTFTSCLCPVSHPWDCLHQFLMCFTCAQLPLPPVSVSSLCLCLRLHAVSSHSLLAFLVRSLCLLVFPCLFCFCPICVSENFILPVLFCWWTFSFFVFFCLRTLVSPASCFQVLFGLWIFCLIKGHFQFRFLSLQLGSSCFNLNPDSVISLSRPYYCRLATPLQMETTIKF